MLIHCMKKGIVFILSIFVVFSSYSQGEIDAFRSSRNDLQGTARAQAMGGAFGALGGDVSGIVINPAGIGIYRSSEIVATMSLSNFNITTNDEDHQSKSKFNFDHLAYVGYFPLGNSKGQSINFGFTYNRLKNFDRDFIGSNVNRTTSLTDYMANITDGYLYSEMEGGDRYRGDAPWLGVLGWNTYLLNTKPGSNNSYESVLYDGELVDSKIRSRERGRIEAYDFTVGSNLSDKFFMGLTFSLTDLYYQMSSTYEEYFANDGGLDLDNVLETSGSGYQLKLGAIFRPVDQLRLGVSYHSPTWYSLKDYYQATVTPYDVYYEDNNGVERPAGSETTPDYAEWNYRLRTPYSWTFSLAAILSSQAILSLDYEIKDYSCMNLKDNAGYNLKDDNDVIKDDFTWSSHLRAGLEYKFTPQFSGRLGYAWMGTPYTDDFKDGKMQVMTAGTAPQYTIEGDVHHLTAGLGYRFTPQFYMDVAFVYRTQTDDFYYYSPMPGWNMVSDAVSFKSNTYKGLLTLGYKF